MPYLINPGGRFVCIEDQNDYEKYSRAPGFRIPENKELADHIHAKMAEMDQMKNPVNYDGSIYMATVSQGGKDGYGISSAKIIRELQKLDVKISTSNQGQKVGILYHAPYSLIKMENPYRIIYTMFESDKIPDDWVPYLEEADKVIVPSKWCQEVFAKSGVKAEVVNLGYDDTVFKYKKRVLKRSKRQTFTFLHYNAFNIRKGFTEVLKAFTEEFGKDEPVRMIFKTALEIPPLPLSPSQYPNIKVLTGPISDLELAKLCENSDAFVFPSRGEGFGITPLEAMATGLPTIVPNAHGISEYFNDKYMYEVNVAEKCPALYARYKGVNVGEMVVCDVKHLRQQMRYIYEHQKEAMEKGKLAADYVKQWTFENTAKNLKKILDEVIVLPATQRPLRNVLKLEKVK